MTTLVSKCQSDHLALSVKVITLPLSVKVTTLKKIIQKKNRARSHVRKLIRAPERIKFLDVEEEACGWRASSQEHLRLALLRASSKYFSIKKL